MQRGGRRDPTLARLIVVPIALPTEEILASLRASLMVADPIDKDNLTHKAAFEAVNHGVPMADAMRLMTQLRGILEKLL